MARVTTPTCSTPQYGIPGYRFSETLTYGLRNGPLIPRASVPTLLQVRTYDETWRTI